MSGFVSILSSMAVPFVILILCGCFLRSGKLYDSFVEGAREGLQTAVNLLPTMTLLLTALTMFRESGAADGIARVLAPVCDRIGIPEGIVPLVITRPFSGSASTAAFADLLAEYGADSPEAFAAALVMGCGDTLVYVVSVYFSVTRVRRTRCTVPVAVFTAILGVFAACILTNFFYRG